MLLPFGPNPREWVLRRGDGGQPVDFFDEGENRGIFSVARRRDDTLLKIMAWLRQQCEVVRALRFAHEGERR